MNQLINTIKRNGKIAVNAKDLYNYLELKTPFRKWIHRMINNYGFQKNLDYIPTDKNVRSASRHHGGKIPVGYILTLDTAKEISMVQRNVKGREARRYFIRVQKQYQNQLLNVNDSPVVKD